MHPDFETADSREQPDSQQQSASLAESTPVQGSVDPAEAVLPEATSPEDDEFSSPAIWRWTAVRIATAILAGATFFSGGYFVHAGINWPDFQQHEHLTKAERLMLKVTPREGVALDARWGDLLPRLVADGVIDLEKFSAAAARGGHSLTDDQLRLLTAGGDDPIAIDAHSSKFVLNALWAVGLATENKLLTDGPMGQRPDGAATLASTAGWTLGKEPGPSYLGTLNLLPLKSEHQHVVEEVAHGVYRPCCNNPTSFPDCNHGMAALGLVEIMAYQGATADEIFDALKVFNAYWYPEQYLMLAAYYDRQSTKWDKADPRELLDAEHSAGNGWKQIAAAVQQEDPFLIPRSGGGGCSA